jgi:phosphatidylglycerophosphate synthase
VGSRFLGAAAFAQVTLLVLLSVLNHLGPIGVLAGLGYAAVVLVLLALAVRRHGTLGPADKVTLARSTLVGGVTALIADTVQQPAPVAPLVALGAVALMLDAVDGWVARRTGTASRLGARFDMEVDAFLILVLSVAAANRLGPWVLAIGLMRYAFVAAGFALDWLRTTVPPSLAGKVVAAAQGVVLLVVASEVLPPVVAIGCVAGALAALAWSFGRSVRWLYGNRAVTAARTRSGSGRGIRSSATPWLVDPA